MMKTQRIALQLEEWLTMVAVIDRILSAPYSAIPGSVHAARKWIRVQRQIERAREDSGLEPISANLARQFGVLDEKSQRYEFADRDNWGRYVAGRRAILECEVTLELPVLAPEEIGIPMSTLERAVIAPLLEESQRA